MSFIIKQIFFTSRLPHVTDNLYYTTVLKKGNEIGAVLTMIGEGLLLGADTVPASGSGYRLLTGQRPYTTMI